MRYASARHGGSLSASRRRRTTQKPYAEGVDDASAGTGEEAGGAAHSPLAMDAEEFRALAHRAVDLAADHLAALPQGPVFRPLEPAHRAALADQPLPAAPTDAGEILDRFAREVLPYPMGNGHPRFFGWVNSAPSPIGVVGELLAAAMNPSVAGGDHAAVFVEHAVVRWLMELVGFPAEGSTGLLVSGGSAASLTALAAARHAAAAADGHDVRAQGVRDGPPLVLYTSEEGHGALRKSAELLGLGGGSVRVVPVDAAFRLDVAALHRAIEDDRAAGRRPFCVAASAGTVNTGAVDPLVEIADACAEHRLWFHVDGAYGAPAVLDPEAAPLLRGLDRVDSLALDPHKWLSVPVECGCVLVRDAELLRSTFSLVPAYLRTEEGRGFGGPPWFSEYGFQQSRGFRALKLWMTLLHAGRDGVAATVAGHRRLAARLAALVAEAPDLELLAPVPLSIVCFRASPPALAGDDAALDRLNRELVADLQAEGAVFVSGTRLRGREALRACILHHGTREADLVVLVDEVRRAAARRASSAAS